MPNVRRREFITLLGGAAAAWPLAARAQQAEKMRRIGILLPAAPDDGEVQSWVGAFLQGLAQSGWITGRNIRIETRWTKFDPEDTRKYAAELVALAPDAILATGNSTVGHDYPPPTDVPRHRWRQFVNDCQSFLNSSQNWAERAVELGWDGRALFGCHRNYPLMHLGSAGLLWAVNGGKLVELHRDWAVIEVPVNRSQRTFSRRDVAAGKVTLPWDRA